MSANVRQGIWLSPLQNVPVLLKPSQPPAAPLCQLLPEASCHSLEPRARAAAIRSTAPGARLGMVACCQLWLPPHSCSHPRHPQGHMCVDACVCACDWCAVTYVCMCGSGGVVGSNVYILPAVCVCASRECTQECGSGMWALLSFACKPLVYLRACTREVMLSSGRAHVSGVLGEA